MRWSCVRKDWIMSRGSGSDHDIDFLVRAASFGWRQAGRAGHFLRERQITIHNQRSTAFLFALYLPSPGLCLSSLLHPRSPLRCCSCDRVLLRLADLHTFLTLSHRPTASASWNKLFSSSLISLKLHITLRPRHLARSFCTCARPVAIPTLIQPG